jgi:hypothetical protein
MWGSIDAQSYPIYDDNSTASVQMQQSHDLFFADKANNHERAAMTNPRAGNMRHFFLPDVKSTASVASLPDITQTLLA